MANALTRVPDRPVPALPRAIDALVPVADVFMIAMVSRPESGSLRQTWVTPATLWLAAAAGLAATAAAVFLAGTRSPAGLAVAVLAAVFGLGCAAVVTVAVAQRRARQ